MGLGRYAEAVAAYEKEPADPENNFDIQGANLFLGRLDEAIIRLRQQALHAGNAIENHRAHEFLTGLYFLNDQPDLALTHSRELTNLPAFPTMARRLDCAAFWANQVSDYASLGKIRGTLNEIQSRWPNAFTRCAAAHAEALEVWQAGDLKNTERLLLEACGPRNRVLSVFALFDLAAFLTKHSSAKVAEGYWKDLEDRRGLILEAWFPGMLPMSWLNCAIAADKAGDRTVAREYSQKVLNLWSVTNPNLRIVRTAGNLARK
jgi:tetratricopeptide (TPR) repeat protein